MYVFVDSRKESGVHWSAPKQGDRTEELKEITAMLVERLNFFFYLIYSFYVINCMWT